MPGWSERVAYGEGPGEGFAYHPNQIIARGKPDDLKEKIVDAGGVVDEISAPTKDGFVLVTLKDVGDLLGLIENLRDDGVDAAPNHVLFGHDLNAAVLAGNPLYGNPLYGNPLYGNPLYGNPLYGNPLYGNPLYGNPLYGNPLYGNPLYGNPLYGNPLYGNEWGDSYKETGAGKNAAKPAPARTPRTFNWPGDDRPKVFVFDSGISAQEAGWPQKLKDVSDASIGNHGEVPDMDGDKELDPIAGHGTFIAGLIELLTPGCDIRVKRIFKNDGGEADVSEWDLVIALEEIEDECDENTIINLSLGGYAWNKGMNALRRVIRRLQEERGTVIVASAGNDGIPRPIYPAAFRNVVSVGALGPNGPAPFSNWGPWVRASAPGVDQLSTFSPLFARHLPAGRVCGYLATGERIAGKRILPHALFHVGRWRDGRLRTGL